VLDDTPSRLSFPSAHAASTTAAAIALSPLLGPAVLIAPVVMGTGRILLGVHYPTDVLAGSALGALAGWATLRLQQTLRRNNR
jgi:membrane-associated phospholipid phosphatase